MLPHSSLTSQYPTVLTFIEELGSLEKFEFPFPSSLFFEVVVLERSGERALG